MVWKFEDVVVVSGVLLAVLAAVVGCAGSGIERSLSPGSAPPDFALVLTIASPQPTDARHLRPAQYVLEPDGTLRAAIGPGTHAELLPPVTARLSPADLNAVWRDTAPLLPPSPESAASDPVLLVSVTAHRRKLRGYFDPEAADSLLRRLAALRGDGRAPNPGP